MNNRWGLHWANVPIDERLKKLALSMGGDCYLVIDGAWGAIPKIREARPNAIIVNRHAVPNWMEMKPEIWAGEMVSLFDQHKQYTTHIELECEPDIFPDFPGWGQQIIDRLKFAADWNIKVARRLRELCPGVIIHSPPLAHERLDLPQWFEIWKPVLDACDMLDMHCYWEKDGQYFRPGLYDRSESIYRAFRYRLIHNFLESRNYHIPMMVTECGNFAPDRPDYADELIYYFSELEKDADYMLGGCVFILKSNQSNWVNDLTRQSDIETFSKKIAGVPKNDYVYPRVDKPELPNKEEVKMTIPQGWEKVPEKIRQWYPILKKEQWVFSPPIIKYAGKDLCIDRIGACIIKIESGGDPKAVGGAGHAHGLMQVWKDHYPTLNLFDPTTNIGTGLKILKNKLSIAKGDLRDALYYYSGGTNWASPQAYRETYWESFVELYQQWFGDDLEPNQEKSLEIDGQLQVIDSAADVIKNAVAKMREGK